jgi:hypothetical protein
MDRDEVLNNLYSFREEYENNIENELSNHGLGYERFYRIEEAAPNLEERVRSINEMLGSIVKSYTSKDEYIFENYTVVIRDGELLFSKRKSSAHVYEWVDAISGIDDSEYSFMSFIEKSFDNPENLATFKELLNSLNEKEKEYLSVDIEVQLMEESKVPINNTDYIMYDYKDSELKLVINDRRVNSVSIPSYDTEDFDIILENSKYIKEGLSSTEDRIDDMFERLDSIRDLLMDEFSEVMIAEGI